MSLAGIDVSAYQPAGDWSKLAGIDFAVARATLGTGYVDPLYRAHLAGAQSVGIIPGAYHYLSHGGASAQADLFWRTIGGPDGLLTMLDCEDATLTYVDVATFVARWKSRTAHTLFIYAGQPFWARLGNKDMRSLGPWWLPNYPGGSGYPGDASPQWNEIAGGQKPTVWQWGPIATPAFPHPVDGNAFRGTRDELAAFAGGVQPAIEDPMIYQDGPVQTAIVSQGTAWRDSPGGPLTPRLSDGGRYVVLGYSADRKFAECSGFVTTTGKLSACLWTATSALSAFAPLSADCSAAVAAATAPLNARISAAKSALG